MRIVPSAGYIGTAAFFSYTAAALFGYPSAAIRSAPGIAPDDRLWFWIIIVLGSVLTGYSAIPKPSALLKANWIVVPLICLCMLIGCWYFNPQAVEGNIFMVVYFSAFTLGFPFALPLVAGLLHFRRCKRISEMKAPNVEEVQRAIRYQEKLKIQKERENQRRNGRNSKRL